MRRDWSIVALAAAAALLISPLWLAGTPAMPDYPARLAGFYLIGGGHSAFYGIHWAAIPNLGSEIAVPFLARFLPLDVAARLFLSVGVAMWVVGPALIQRALYGRIGPMGLAGAFFAYNVNLMWGFFNYYFAGGLCLVVFAGWIATQGWPRARRIAVFALALVALYFCHIMAAALFIVLAAAFEAPRRSWRHWMADIALAALPIAILFLLKPVGGADEGLKFNLVGSFVPRVESLVQCRFSHPAWIVIAGLALLFGLGLWRKAVVIHPAMRLCLIAMAVLAVFGPETLMGGSGVHLRTPPIAAALLFAAADLRASRAFGAALAAAILVVMGLLSAGLTQEWRRFALQIDEFRQSLEMVPKNARLLTVIDKSATLGRPERLYWHIAEYAIIDRDAFTATMFATRGQHIVVANRALAPFAAQSASQGVPPHADELANLAAGAKGVRPEIEYLSNFPCHYDEVVLAPATGSAPKMLRLSHRGSFFALYDVRRPPGCSTTSATRP